MALPSDETMRKSRLSDEQIVAILREAERTSLAEAAKKNKVSEQTIYTWRKHFAGLAPNDVKRLKALELENAHAVPAVPRLSAPTSRWLRRALAIRNATSASGILGGRTSQSVRRVSHRERRLRRPCLERVVLRAV